MTTQLLIYKTAVPVSAARHGDCFVEAGADYSFSGAVNSVPLMAVEFPNAAAEYPIVFAGAEGEILPAVILGLRGNENLFLSGASAWEGRYVPAFLRRYPFVFSQEGEQFTLCVDEEFAGLNRAGRGEALFDRSGAPTAYVQGLMAFLQDFQVQSVRTQVFCARLKALDLLEPTQANVTEASGAQLSLGGFMAVSRERLRALPGETLAELVQGDEMELLMLHLYSLRNFEGLKDRLAAHSGVAGEGAPGLVH